MPLDYIPAEDLPYGPGNPDYEYDGRDDAGEAAHAENLLRQRDLFQRKDTNGNPDQKG